MNYRAYRKVIGVIQDIRRGTTCCTQLVSVRTNNGIVNFVVSGNTLVIDNVRLRRGMRVAAFYDTRLPAPAIFPPQYQAEIITALRRDQNVTLNYFDETLTASDNSLKLNVDARTNIETKNGQPFPCRIENSELLVYYTITTFSIPPQTPPQRIIVMC